MELLFELVFGFFGELLLQLMFEVLSELGWRTVRKPSADRAPASPLLTAAGYLLFGAVAGAVSLWLFPNLMIRSASGRLASLLLMPIACGAAMAALGAWRRRHEQGLVGLDRFAYGFLFALAMSGLRYAFGTVPA